jgi:anti-anti-sigma factor
VVSVHPAPQPPAASFSCQRRPDGTVVCHVGGDVDADSRIALRGAFDRALGLARRDATIVVDLAALGFCDSTGLNALIRLRNDAGTEGVHMVLSEPAPQFRRLLEVTGADALWVIHPGLEAAIRATTPSTHQQDLPCTARWGVTALLRNVRAALR